jgi:hypothetical protein
VNGAPMGFNRPSGHGQSEPEASGVTRSGFVEPVEAVKHSLLGIVGDPGPLIRDGELYKSIRSYVSSNDTQRDLNAWSPVTETPEHLIANICFMRPDTCLQRLMLTHSIPTILEITLSALNPQAQPYRRPTS